MSTSLAKIENKPLRQVSTVKELLLNRHAIDQIGRVAAAGVRPEQLTRHLMQCLAKTPKLAECKPHTVLDGLMTCAELGFIPNTPLGAAYLIPYGTDCQLVIGYRGLMTLALRSGDVRDIQSGVATREEVETGDFDWLHGSESYLRHRETHPDGEHAYAWALARMASGGEQFTVLPWSKIMQIRDASQGWKSAVKFNKTATSPWSTHEREMAEKTAIRALCKHLPLSPQGEHAMSMVMDRDEARSRRDDNPLAPAVAPDPVPADDAPEGEEIEGTATEGVKAEPEAPPQPTKAPAKGQKPKKAEPKPDTGAKTQQPKPEPEGKADNAGTDAAQEDRQWPEDIESIAIRIVEMTGAAETEADVGEIEDLFGDNLKSVQEFFPEAVGELFQMIEDARERVNGGGDE